MLYLWTLDAHELHGPFTDRNRAHSYARLRGLTSYQIVTDTIVKDHNLTLSLRAVPVEYR